MKNYIGKPDVTIMCGILFFRIINLEKKTQYKKLYQKIHNAIASRGPEFHNDVHFDSEGVYLTFHRLATYGELDNANMMPIQRDGWIVMCNGDIYNHQELWKTFETKSPVTHNDCEVLIPLLENTSIVDKEFPN